MQLVALAINRLGLGNGGPGLLYFVWGAGGIVGSGVLLRVVRRFGYGTALCGGALVFGVLVAVSGVGTTAVVIVVMVPVGLGFALVESALMGVIPRLVDDSVIGRVYGVCELIYAGAAGIGAALAPALIGWLGIGHSLAAVGVGYAVLAVLATVGCLRLDRGQRSASRVRDLLHGVPFLTPLPLPQLERLVHAAVPVETAPGEFVVRAGEVGEDFFVVDRGTVEVVEYGRNLGPGEGFGEIALLRDVPRTASIRASGDTQLWRVSRAIFLAALGASGEARTSADDVVAEHLARPRRPSPRPR